MTSAANQSVGHPTRDRSRGFGRAIDRVLSTAPQQLRRGAAVPALLALLLASCSGPEQELLLLRGESMGTTWSVQLALEANRHLEKAELVALHAALQAELDQVNAEMSTYLETSELARFNASSSTDWQPVSAPLAQICAQALEIGAKSDGLYDVTVGPLVELWGFGPGPNKGRTTVPSDAEITAVLAVVGQAKLAVRATPPALKKSVADLKVDLSSIAKGHGVDRLAAKLDSAGFAAWFVEIGGEVRTRGEKTKGQPWRLGIERPSSGERAVQRLVELREAAVATSGNYRNFFESGGQRFAHTLDPRTGRPAASSPASVSVFASTCAEADAWATALMALGAARGFEIAEREQIAALFLLPGANGGFEEKPTSAYHRFGRPVR
ncbi:MAG: FAD:protein FMN transferase [Planctomycetes bacterium]|nr:FAD:protein FMN transferase [Planctomycetota bacterium]